MQAQQRVVVEVRLDDASFGEGDFAVQGGRQTELNAAFYLLPNKARVDGIAALHHAHHAVHPNGTRFVDGNLGNLAHHTAESLMKRHAPAHPGARNLQCQGLMPTRHFGQTFQYPPLPGMVREQITAVLQGVLPRFMGHLVQEAFLEERLM